MPAAQSEAAARTPGWQPAGLSNPGHLFVLLVLQIITEVEYQCRDLEMAVVLGIGIPVSFLLSVATLLVLVGR
jgi:hypothetical protein